MLCKDANERISTHDALSHEWFEDESVNLNDLTTELFGNQEKRNLHTSNLTD